VKSLVNWLPAQVDRRVRIAAWATLVSQILIIGTGGAVRLTGSGLGCPTWPRCTEESFVATAEMGVHGIIEFGNRLLTFLLIIIALVTFAFVLRMRRERPELFRLAVVIGLGIPAQAVLGGITVLTNLNPYVVGLHYVLSAVLVGLASVLLYRVRVGPQTRLWSAPTGVRFASVAMFGVLGISILMGVLTTGSGPHAGDGGAARNGLDSEFLQHLHSWPSYLALTLTAALTVFAWSSPSVSARYRRSITALLLLTGVQIAVGLYQARNGLPELLVGIHLVLAAVLVAVAVSVVLSLRLERSTEQEAGRPPLRQTAASSR
jgi:cytochrome c oxidase assembly protein subunit 15